MLIPSGIKEHRKTVWQVLATFLLVMASFILTLTPTQLRASEAHLVTWDMLVPPEHQGYASELTRQQPNAGTVLNDPQAALAISHVDRPIEDAARIWEKWDTRHVAAASDVLNKSVLIDGYVLPLVWDGARVVDFLLVPWVGACIHMPSPPPNQIVHVSYPEGLILDKQFQAVRLSGVLQNNPTQHDLYLIDGARPIPVSYSLSGAHISGAPGKVMALSAADLPVLARLQIWINALFTNSMEAIARDGSSNALIFALMLSFAYGALHALGPGHGKSVVVSYFVGTGGSLSRGLTMGLRIAVFHVLSAVIVVFLLDFAVRQSTGAAPADYRIIRLASYALIMTIGAAMLWKAVEAMRNRNGVTAQLGPEHVHAHDHHALGGCSACAAASKEKGSGWIAASVGAVPCTGAILVMLFGLANDLVLPAILMVIFISAGMALAMAAIGVIALYGRRLAENHFGADSERSQRFDITARLMGSSCVLAIGALLFVVTLAYPPILQTPPAEIVSSPINSTKSGS